MGDCLLTRRQVLAAGMAGGAGLILGTRAFEATVNAASIKPAGSDLGAIEHVVFMMQENRSFDHYFGTYRGVRGFDDHPPGQLGNFAQPWPANTTDPPLGTLLPFHLDTVHTDAECTYDLAHDWAAQHRCWNDGKMDSFATTHTSASGEGANGTLTMGYYTRRDLRFYYALADAFTICDSYFCSVMGPTHPNRSYAISGTIDPAGKAGGPVLVTSSDPSSQFSLGWTTMPERLQDKGISWKVYNPPGSDYQPTSPVAILISDNMLLHFSQYSNPSLPLYQNAFTPIFPDDFARDVASGSLPQVSWIIPPVLPKGLDEHPPAPPPPGEWFTHQVLNTLASNPSVWSKTVLFLTYDENDGFFDHVAPPTPPPGTKDEYVTVSPLPSSAAGIAGPIGLGFRVPMLVVSPFSRGGFVCSETFDHTSQLRFLETRFGVGVPNLSTWRRRVTGDLTSTIHRRRPVSMLPPLPKTAELPRRVVRECNPAQLIEINVATPPYPLPTPQWMPSQEPGHVRRISS